MMKSVSAYEFNHYVKGAAVNAIDTNTVSISTYVKDGIVVGQIVQHKGEPATYKLAYRARYTRLFQALQYVGNATEHEVIYLFMCISQGHTNCYIEVWDHRGIGIAEWITAAKVYNKRKVRRQRGLHSYHDCIS